MAKQNPKKQTNNKKSYYKRKARKDASKGNYQDAFSDSERAKGRPVPLDTGSSDNDPQWYVPNGQMLKDVASINFGIPTGKPMLSPKSVGNTTIATQTDPGIMVLDYLPTMGFASEPTDPVNVAMNSYYQSVRRATTVQSPYDAPALMMATAAVASAYGYYAWMTRIYGILNNYEILNRYTPQAIIQAMGVNFQSLQTNLASFRAYVNQFAYQLGSFAIPKNIDIFKRWIFMNENVYMDASSPRAQYYMYNPLGFWKWTVEQVPDPENPDVGTEDLFTMQISPLPSAGTPGKLMTYSDILTYGDSLLQPLFESEDVRFITSDILKAYGEGGLIRPLPLADTYSLSPVHNPEVLSQIENATILPAYSAAPVPDGSTIEWKVQGTRGLNNDYLQTTYNYVSSVNGSGSAPFVMSTVFNNDNTIINFHGISNPTPEQVMVATRLMINGGVSVGTTSSSTNPKLKITLTNVASEVICGSRLLYFDSNASLSALQVSTCMITNITNVADVQTSISALATLSKFDWHPKVSVGLTGFAGSTIRWLSDVFLDIDNFAYISQQVLENINYTALCGLFVPKSLNLMK